MTHENASTLRFAWRIVLRPILANVLAVGFVANQAPCSCAAPLNFALFNVSGSNQSRLEMVASAQLSDGELTSAPQLAPGGLNGAGSLSTLYNDTAANDSRLVTSVTQYTIAFPGGSTAVASYARGLLGDLAISPNVGGTSGTAPANYGVKFSAPQNIPVPPIDLTPVGINGTLNLGTITSLDWNVALRNVVVDVVSGDLPLTPGAAYPQTFDSSQLTIGISGTSDMLLGATVKQASVVDWAATGFALAALQPTLAAQGINLTIVNNGFLQLSYTIGFGFSAPLPLTNAINDDASMGALEHIGSNLRLTVPVKFTVVPSTLPSPLDTLLTTQFGLSGKLIGQTPFVNVEVPEPSAAAIALIGLVMFASILRRKHT